MQKRDELITPIIRVIVRLLFVQVLVSGILNPP